MTNPSVVVGAGPIGSALAIALARGGREVLLLDRSTFPRDKPCGEGLMPLGAQVLAELGIDLDREGFPRLLGVEYRLGGAGAGAAFAPFRGRPGHGVRRDRFDALLLGRSEATAGVRVETGCEVTGLTETARGVSVETARGTIEADVVIAADGLRSSIRRLMGWDRPAGGARFGLVGHLAAPAAAPDRVAITLLPGIEVYSAPSGCGETLVAVLGPRGALRRSPESVADAYRRLVETAHPELAGAAATRVTGAGPFRVSPARVASNRVFLAGDAAGFIDPLTGDAMAAGLAGARHLAEVLAANPADPALAAAAHRQFLAAQHRRRLVVTSLALFLTGSPAWARRAVSGTARRPSALQALVEVNGGTRGLRGVGLRDWAALAGFAA